ncbi:hypothetical protein [Streptomyces sp. IBSBF 3352]|uniref:hypothetical protein n=1 Tax=Streptomyces sp. IBSBF 3352 TaxID=2903523 RepID=UPI002FDBFC42
MERSPGRLAPPRTGEPPLRVLLAMRRRSRRSRAGHHTFPRCRTKDAYDVLARRLHRRAEGRARRTTT